MNDETMKKIDQVTNEVSEKITNEQLTETRDEATGKPVNEQPKERAKEPIEEPVKELDADAGVDATEEPIEKPIEEPIEEPIQPTSHTKKATRDEPRVGLANSEFQRGNQEVPEEIKKWNWGAFSLNIIWGIGNKTYLPLLCLIPLFNFVWCLFADSKAMKGHGEMETIRMLKHSNKSKKLGVELA